MNAEIYNVETGDSRTLPHGQAESIVRGSMGEWSFTKPLPAGWEKQIPKYRATRDLQPSPKERHRQESPFSSIQDDSVWQYGEGPVKAGEMIESTAWPHPSFQPLNDSAREIHRFFMSATKITASAIAVARRSASG
jgi:hypothetical protein